MAGEQIRKVYLDEDEGFSERQSYGRRVVTPVRYSTDPRDVGWVRPTIPCQTGCPVDTNVPAHIQIILENRHGRAQSDRQCAARHARPDLLASVRGCPPRSRVAAWQTRYVFAGSLALESVRGLPSCLPYASDGAVERHSLLPGLGG
jgi:hypothetical protein